jgi:hypothetical protein
VQSLRRGRDRLESLQLIVKRGLAQPFQRTIPIFIVSITSKSLGLIWVRTPVLACQEAQPGVLAGRPRPLSSDLANRSRPDENLLESGKQS